MGIWAWMFLLAAAAGLATAARFTLFARDREPTDHDWFYIAGGALVGGFTSHAWYPGIDPVVDGLNLVPALVGALVGAAVVEAIYRLVLRPRQPHA